MNAIEYCARPKTRIELTPSGYLLIHQDDNEKIENCVALDPDMMRDLLDYLCDALDVPSARGSE